MAERSTGTLLRNESKRASSKHMLNFEYLILRQVLTWLNSDQERNVNRMVIPDLRASAKCNVQTR